MKAKFWDKAKETEENAIESSRSDAKKPFALGMVAGIALSAVLAIGTMLALPNDTQGAEEFAASSSISQPFAKLIDPSNGVFEDESAVSPSTTKLMDPANGVYADESEVKARLSIVEAPIGIAEISAPKLTDPSSGVFIDESAVESRSIDSTSPMNEQPYKVVDPANGVLKDESEVDATFRLNDPANGVLEDESAIH